MIKEAILRGLKEFLRIALIATLPLIITGIENNSLDWKLVLTAGVIAVLKAIDRGIHEYGVLEEEEKSTAKKPYTSEYITGVVRF
jgi:hypothetical protein